MPAGNIFDAWNAWVIGRLRAGLGGQGLQQGGQFLYSLMIYQ